MESKLATAVLINILVVPYIAGGESFNGKCQSSTVGNEFIFGVINPSDGNDSQVVILDIFSDHAGSVSINIPYLSFNKTYNLVAHTSVSVTLHNITKRNGTFTDYQGYQITSTVPAAVIVSFYQEDLNAFGELEDSFVVLPTTSLGTHYNVAAGNSFYGGKGKVMVVSTADDTRVSIMTHDKLITVTLQRMEVYQLESPSSFSWIRDLAETIVQSSKPTAVFILEIKTPYDSRSTQMIPTAKGGNKFIVANASPYRMGLEFFANTSKETIYVKFQSQSKSSDFIQSKQSEYSFGTDPVLITTNTSVNLVQYLLHSHVSFMTIVPSIDQYLNYYTFYVPSARPDSFFSPTKHNNITIIAPANETSGIIYDNNKLDLKDQTVLQVTSTNFVTINFEVAKGKHTLRHMNSNIKLGLLVYGTDRFGGYGFYPGFNLHGCNADSTFTPLTTVMPHYETVKQPVKGTGQYCFSCSRISHLKYCDKVVRCQENEICFVERYEVDNVAEFRSGCVLQDTCQEEHKLSECTECCETNLCNGKGCGDQGLPSLAGRGPICFDCHNVGSPEECHQVNICHQGQRCIAEKYEWASEFLYKFGCASALCHPLTRSIHPINKRLTTVCHQCCDGDICNTSCNGTSHGGNIPNIIG